jgi:hypothetical protein
MRKPLIAFSILLFAISANAADRRLHRTAQLDPNGSVSIDTHNGSVVVTAWNQPTVDVSAVILPAEFGNDEDVQKTDVKVTGSGGSVRIESDYTDVPTHFTWLGFSRNLPPIQYTISVPATARLYVDAHNASIKVNALRNDVRISTHNGDIDIRDLDGGLNVESHNGDVRASFLRFAKSARVETHNGSIDLGLPSQARFHVNASGHHMGVSSDFAININSMRDSQYVGDVNGGGPEVRVSTHNGSLKLRKL